MASAPSDWATAPATAPAADLAADLAAPAAMAEDVQDSAKILVAGGFGVGKTTLIGSVSEIAPLRTEETLTTRSAGVDDLALLEHKSTTTVAMDFGRRTFPPGLVLYLFGAPGQQRFWPLWQGLAQGAIGALVLIDTRRLEASFEVLDQLETHQPCLPLAVAVNHFPDTEPFPHTLLREHLDLRPDTPIVDCNARERTSSAGALIALVDYARSLPEEPR